MATQLWAVLLVLFATFIGSFSPILIKIGSSKSFSKISDIIKNYYLWWGIFIFGVSTILFIPALKGGDLTVLYPLVALNYIFVSILSKRILKEEMNKFKWIGVLMIIVGVISIGLGS